MESITLGGKKHKVHKPNLAAALDIVSLWGEAPSKLHIGRLCASAIGISCPSVHMPRYSMIDATPIGYGGHCMSKLLERGVYAGDIYTEGLNLIMYFIEILPKKEEVEKAVSFLEQKEEEGILSSELFENQENQASRIS